jgi:hypothetical protein
MSESLLVRLGEVLWGVPIEAIGELRKRDHRVLIRLHARALLVDRVEGRKDLLERPLGPVLSGLMPEGVRALGVVSDLAVPIVDPARPPHPLLYSDPMEGERE